MGNVNVILIGFMAIGQYVFTLGIANLSPYLIILGRILLGIGGEFINITCSKMEFKYFRGKEFGLVSGIFMCFMRTTNFVNSIITPIISHKSGLVAASNFAFYLAFMSFIASITLKIYDSKFEHRCAQKEKLNDISLSEFFKASWHFPRLAWIIIIYTMFLYVMANAYMYFASKIIIEDWLPDMTLEVAQEKAGVIMSSYYLSSLILLPIIGYIMDAYGKRITMLTMASSLGLLTHVLFLYFYPLYPMILLGIAKSFGVSIIWTALAFLIPNKFLGFGYGILSVIQNIGLGVVPIVIVALRNGSSSNKVVHLFFICFTFVMFLISIYIIYLDKKRSISLDNSDQEAILDALKSEEIAHIFPDQTTEFDDSDNEEEKLIYLSK